MTDTRSTTAGPLALALTLAVLALPACDDELAGAGLVDGVWGGQHVAMTVTGTTATLEYDCAHGDLELPAEPAGNGEFDADGTHTLEHGGPVLDGEPPDTHPARYHGTLFGNVLTLTVTIVDLDQTLGPFVLKRGEPGQVFKCL